MAQLEPVEKKQRMTKYTMKLDTVLKRAKLPEIIEKIIFHTPWMKNTKDFSTNMDIKTHRSSALDGYPVGGIQTSVHQHWTDGFGMFSQKTTSCILATFSGAKISKHLL